MQAVNQEAVTLTYRARGDSLFYNPCCIAITAACVLSDTPNFSKIALT